MEEIWDNISQNLARWEKVDGFSAESTVMITECQDPHTMSQRKRLLSSNKELAQHALEFQTVETWVNISLNHAKWEKEAGSSAELTVTITECQDPHTKSQRRRLLSFNKEHAQLAQEFLMEEIWDNISQNLARWEKAVGFSAELMVTTIECLGLHTKSQRKRLLLSNKVHAQLAQESLMVEIWDNISQKAAKWEKEDGSSAELTVTTTECQGLHTMNQRRRLPSFN